MTALLQAIVLQAGHNAASVVLGAALLGLAAGAAGSVMVLRRRALVSDAMAHAALPGLAAAFLLMAGLGGSGRWLPGLMAGAALTAGLALLAVEVLAARTRLPADAAIATTLSVAFGLGLVLLTLIQGLRWGEPAGLEGFLVGSTAGMLRADVAAVAAVAALVLAAVALLRRPLALLAFDEGHAAASGLPVRLLDRMAMLLVLLVVIAGIRLVGVVLVVALLILPALAARAWTRRAGPMMALAAVLGGAAGWVGAALSAAAPGLPAGPLVVLCAAALAGLSLLLRGPTARRRPDRRPLIDAAEGALWTRLRLEEPRSPLLERDDGRTPLGAVLPAETLEALRQGRG